MSADDEVTAALIELFRKAMLLTHADDWTMDACAEAAHVCARAITDHIAELARWRALGTHEGMAGVIEIAESILLSLDRHHVISMGQHGKLKRALSLRAAGDVGAAAPAAALERLRETGVVAEVESLMAEDEAGLERMTISPAEFDVLLDDVIEGDSDAVKTRQAEDDAYLASGPWPDRMRYPAADTGETP